MSKYTFERLGADRFESMVQALLEQLYRTGGTLTQFGPGKDGAREATWSQPPSHRDYIRPVTASANVPKEWVFQAKFHDIGMRGWRGSRSAVESELTAELDKVVNKHKVPCHKFVLVTNVPFSGVRNVGTRDRVNRVIKKWVSKIPEIEVWDAIDLSRMLDAAPGTRTTYLSEVLPGDVLRELLTKLSTEQSRRTSAFHAYLKFVLRSEREARAEEAGDEAGLKLEKTFVDLDLQLATRELNGTGLELVNSQEPADSHLPNDPTAIPASFALLRAAHSFMLLKGGPGVGKSTVTQFLTLYYAARLVDPGLANKLAQRLKRTGGVSPDQLEAHVKMRYPLRVELRRYADWMARTDEPHFLAKYLVDRINVASSSNLEMDDLFHLASQNPVLLILDGLDEVPHPDLRRKIFVELLKFLDRCEGECGDTQVIVSSRPQGYRGEVERFQPVEWHVAQLSESDFANYAESWLDERITSMDERRDAERRIEEGMKTAAVRQMAATLLQATVMLTIVRRKHAIPHARHKLFEKYVEVIFEREQNKQTVREYAEPLLRLHELVAYKLIQQSGQVDGARPLDRDAFRDCIHGVISDFGPAELGEDSIAEVVNAIVTLAKDRLCLLAGVGDKQEHIDFAIQPFREYFAAAYLANHSDAVPERVYDALNRRWHIWANVLQFYAAFQRPPQQKNWIAETDGTGIDTRTWEGVVELTRRRRTLVSLLPEFVRPRNEYVLRAFQNLFAKATRWTWAKHASVCSRLEAFAPQVFTNLEAVLQPLSIDSDTDLLAELQLLAQAASDVESDRLCEIVNKELCAEPQHRHAVLTVALRQGLNVDLGRFSLDEVAEVFHEVGYVHGRRSSQAFNESQLLDLVFLYGATPLLHTHAAFESGRPQRIVAIVAPQREPMPPAEVLFGLSVTDRAEPGLADLAQELERSDAKCGRYLSALVRAIDAPLHATRFQTAQEEERALGVDLGFFGVANQLGPSPSKFKTEDDWREHKSASLQFVKRIGSEWLSRLNFQDGSWLTSVLHPRAWEHLEPIVSPEQFKWLMDVCLPVVSPLSDVELVPLYQRFVRSSRTDPILMCKCLVNAAKAGGPNLFGGLDRAPDVQLPLGKSAEDANSVLRDGMGVDLPKRWASFIIANCSLDQKVDVDRLIAFWNQHNCEDELPLVEPPRPNWRIISDALNKGSIHADRLAGYLVVCGTRRRIRHHSSGLRAGENSEILDTLGARLRSSVLLGQDGWKLDLSLLLELEPNPQELALWSKQAVLDELGRRKAHSRVAQRLRDTKWRGASSQYRSQLGEFIMSRERFPLDLSLAALSAVLRIDEISAAPLADTDWQAG